MRSTRFSRLTVAAIVSAAGLLGAQAFAQSGWMGSGAGDAALQGSVQGRVVAVERQNGIVRIASGHRTLTLHGTPYQIADAQVGEFVGLDYRQYGNTLWLPDDGAATIGGGAGAFFGGGYGGSGASGGYGDEGQVNGVVGSLDLASGRFTVDGKPFRSHPASLQGVLPGQFVSFSYQRIGNANWVASDTGSTGVFGNGSYGSGNVGGSGSGDGWMR